MGKLSVKVFGAVILALTLTEAKEKIFNVTFCTFGLERDNTGVEAACDLALAVGAILIAVGVVFCLLDVVGQIVLGPGDKTRKLLLIGMVAMILVALLCLGSGSYLAYLWGGETTTSILESKRKSASIAVIVLHFTAAISAVSVPLYLGVSTIVSRPL